MNCKICSADTVKFGESIILGRHRAEYDQCTRCNFISVRQPHWLPEAYSSAITSSDLGTVSRTDQNSLKTKAVIDVLFNHGTRFLDYGAGYGMFVRRMRDLGYNFHAFDLHCKNLFSGQFQIADLQGETFDLITAFEVFEHLEDPADVFNRLLAQGDHLLISTELLPTPTPALGQWWYYGPEHGQHISFYTKAALNFVAKMHQRHLYSNGHNLHLFSRGKISQRLFQNVTRNRVSQLLGLWQRRKSLLEDDFLKNRDRVLAEVANQH